MASVIKGEGAADALSRRGHGPASSSSTTSPAATSRAAAHRPSPIILPPKHLVEYEEFERRSRSHHQGGSQETMSMSLVERKRSLPAESEARSSSDGDDVVVPLHKSAAADVPQSDLICFCVKAPKVPRPRNAFILYRQHYQAQVVAENPRLANPDISKIIGQMWKEQNDESREYWKNLAEQEKQHHRKQHPDYRYQPRRASKSDAAARARPGSATGDGSCFKISNSTGDNNSGDPNRCEKCGGRYIAPLPSARSVRPPPPPPSPSPSCGPVRRSSMPLSAFPRSAEAGGADDHLHFLGRPYPSPKLYKHVQGAAQQQQQQQQQQPLPRDRDRDRDRDAPGRRPLPHRPSHAAAMMIPRSANVGMDIDEGGDTAYAHDYDPRDPRDPSGPSDQKRRRYDLPNLYTTRLDGGGGGGGDGISSSSSMGTPIHGHPQQHRALPGPGPGPAPSPGSPWMAPPPIPNNRHAAAAAARGGYTPQPTPQRQTFLPPPPIQQGNNAYGYYTSTPVSAQAIPVTAMAGLSMRQPPPPPSTPSSVSTTPYSARPPPMSAVGAGNDHHHASSHGRSSGDSRDRDHYPGRLSSDFPEESLRLPPLMTNAVTPMSALSQSRQNQQQKLQQQQLQQQQQQQQQQQNSQQQQQPAESTQPGRLQSMALMNRALAHKVGGGGGGSFGPGRISDMHAYAVAPTPVLERRLLQENTPDRDSQASGIRAMVLSIPYLIRLEYLRRMNPPLSLTTTTAAAARRGPIIAIEGHHRALTDAVGRIVELALRQSGECHVGVWSSTSTTSMTTTSMTTTPPPRTTKKPSTDSGIGSSIDGSMVANMSPASGGRNDEEGDEGHVEEEEEEQEKDDEVEGASDALAEYQALVISWREKTKAIVRHVTSSSSSDVATTVPAASVEKEEDDVAAAAGSPTSVPAPSPSHRAVSSEVMQTGSPADGDRKPSASASASPHHHHHHHNTDPVVPVALITGGYSLTLADRYAMTVPIEDAYAPLDHWEWMAMMWRATAAPDLVVYVDGESSTPSSSSDAAHAPAESSVDTRAQDGVIVLHAVGDDGGKDWTDNNSVLDKKTERRLTFEVMEWVRAFGSGV